MSVVKGLRNLSQMEFYKNAIYMRKILTEWLLRDFGTKRNARSIKQVIKNIDESDQQIIDNIFAKYNKNPNQEYQSEYPEWFVVHERGVIVKLLQETVQLITSANSIYPSSDFEIEYNLRRGYQDKAICTCYTLYQELQYIISIFDTDINKLIPFLECVEKEIELLKGWRRSDNKTRKNTKKPTGNN